jgi:hypothetical protein
MFNLMIFDNYVCLNWLLLHSCDQNIWQNNLKGWRIYFGSWFQKVSPWLLGPIGFMLFSKTLWWREHVEEESCSPDSRQEAEREKVRGYTRYAQGPTSSDQPSLGRSHLLVSTTSQNSTTIWTSSVKNLSLWGKFPIQTVTFHPWSPKAHVHLIIQNVFSPAEWILIIWSVPMLFKSLNSECPFRVRALS